MKLKTKIDPNRPVDMITASGHSVWFDQPERTGIDMRDIKIHSTNMCRYNGAVQWRLIQHLCLCVELAPLYTYLLPKDPFSCHPIIQTGYAAIHDFHEIYVGDVVTGFKQHLPDFQRIENNWEQYLHDYLGMPLDKKDTPFVKTIDMRALAIEMDQLKHPAAARIGKAVGYAKDSEKAIFQKVSKMSLEECWIIVNKALHDAQILYSTEQ